MNPAQRKYALERVDQIARKKIDALSKKFFVEGKGITDEQRAELVRTGKVKLRADVKSISRYADVVQVFDFSKYVRMSGPDPVKFTPAKEDVEAKAQEIRDQIMLGDTEEALRLIKEFSA